MKNIFMKLKKQTSTIYYESKINFDLQNLTKLFNFKFKKIGDNYEHTN